MSTTFTQEQSNGVASSNENDNTTFVVIGSKKMPKLNWTRINYKGENHDNRRLVEHREKDCRCDVCYLEINKLPPRVPVRQQIQSKKQILEDREIKRVKKKAKKEVKDGKQACIRNFFRY
jgi:DNA recombination-dependent growth factor C